MSDEQRHSLSVVLQCLVIGPADLNGESDGTEQNSVVLVRKQLLCAVNKVIQ